jgi:hypothetical protein
MSVVWSHKRHIVVAYQARHTELASARVGIHIEDFIDDGVEVHEPGVFSQVILWLSQERVSLTIGIMNGDFSRFCKRLHNVNLI